MKYLHTMVRVTDLDASLDFYCNKLGLREVRRVDVEAGRFSLIFLAAPGDESAQVELTYNWDPEEYTGGRNFGHLAYAVDDIYAACQRLMDGGVTINRPPRDGHMAFVRSPDGISVELLQSATALATAPADLVVQVQLAVQGVYAAAESSLEAFYVYQTLFGFAATPLGGAGTTSAAANLNAKLVANMVAVGVVGNAARAAVRAPWAARSDAVEARDSLLDELDRLLLVPELDDLTARELRRLAALVVAGVPRPGEDLPELATVELGATEPSLVVAWRLYGDAGRAEEISDRNLLPYPGLVPGGVGLEVLSA